MNPEGRLARGIGKLDWHDFQKCYWPGRVHESVEAVQEDQALRPIIHHLKESPVKSAWEEVMGTNLVNSNYWS